MQKLIAVLLILAFVLPVPVHASADAGSPALDLKYTAPDAAVSFDSVKFAALESSDFVPVERKLIDEQMGKTRPKSTWWKWALGILIVGGIAAAAGGGGGGGETPPPATTGSVSTSW